MRGGECGSHSDHWLFGSWSSYVVCLLDVQLVRLIRVQLDETKCVVLIYLTVLKITLEVELVYFVFLYYLSLMT